MAIYSSFLGATTVSGDEARAFSRMVARGRTSAVVSLAAKNGRQRVAEFAKAGVVTFELKAPAKRVASVSI